MHYEPPRVGPSKRLRPAGQILFAAYLSILGISGAIYLLFRFPLL
jgi:hypothetical protein